MRIEFHQQNYYFVYVTAYDASLFRLIFQTNVCVCASDKHWNLQNLREKLQILFFSF